MDAAKGQAHHDQRPSVEPEESPGNEGEMHPHGDTRLRNAQARTAALEATLADLTARRTSVLKEFAALPSVAEMLPRHANATATSSSASAEAASAVPEKDAVLHAAKAVTQERIRRLNQYNEMRDIGQGLMGIIAESRGVRIKEVQEEFDISAKD
ncbi:putative DNA repair protein swi5 protein [Botryosphaeria dothidea]|uniref:DNA repair protein swi5 protein n=1 Tax=Botryosphaeria dothidea TaxID=55169 RepID=A0A8H4N4Z8_9PEZI|nr:putative DNA repair protein swi5 protein [Botryosphaeria dothidea]